MTADEVTVPATGEKPPYFSEDDAPDAVGPQADSTPKNDPVPQEADGLDGESIDPESEEKL